MTRKAGLTFGAVLIGLFTLTSCAGAVLLVMAHAMPSHSDERRAAELTRSYEENYVESSPEQRELAKQQIISLRTSKWTLYNVGLGMCLVSPCLLFAIFRFRLWDVRNVRAAITPRTRLGLLGLASVAWWALLPALLLEEGNEYAQDDLTPHIDNGDGLLWVFAPRLFFIIWIAALIMGRFLVLRSVLLPANLWCWDSARPYRSLVLSALFGLLGGVLVVLIVWSASNFYWALPSLMVGLYVILSSRAALINVVK